MHDTHSHHGRSQRASALVPHLHMTTQAMSHGAVDHGAVDPHGHIGMLCHTVVTTCSRPSSPPALLLLLLLYLVLLVHCADDVGSKDAAQLLVASQVARLHCQQRGQA
jgi:hypothetical protein